MIRGQRPGFRSEKPDLQIAQDAKDRARQSLVAQYDQLKQYALTIHPDAAPVKIRLEEARKAAEEVHETKFEKLAHGIFLTLEEHCNKIAIARKAVPHFLVSSAPMEMPSQQSSVDKQLLSEVSA